ncbi:MAG: M48 family metallopeptidase [Planctomycetes bacterium]|nr:M48 family metallopeptidase [Planctomycetota bacterium]
MDFFASQDHARRQSRKLLVLFVVAIVAMTAVLYAVALAALGMSSQRPTGASLWRPDLLAGVAIGVSSIILIGSLYKTFELRAGGDRIAQLLGGRRILANSTDVAERRLLNIVEEMALASGIPAPPVYVLDEERGINAFAAGHTPSDAVIGVNRGTLDNLNRDELQGVIAHEFSHVLNGDMRLNLRLIGLLHGILLISLIGYYIMRSVGSSGRSSSRSRGKDSKNAGAQIFLIGLAMWAIGSIGLLAARLIKSAISRQREYLADASAVQFTRNPEGIGGALKKIGGLSIGSRVMHAEAETASHMFFASSFRSHFGGWLATHPPLVVRIQRIDPRFDGVFPKVEPRAPVEERAAPKGRATRGPFEILPEKITKRVKLDALFAMQAIGSVGPDAIANVGRIVTSIPDRVRDAAEDPFDARVVAMALLLEADDAVRARQLELVRTIEGRATLDSLLGIVPEVAKCPVEARLPLMEKLQSALRELSDDQYQRFRKTVLALVGADDRISFFEFILQRMLLTHLDRAFTNAKPPRARYLTVTSVTGPATALISILAHVSHDDEADALRAYQSGAASLGLKAIPPILSKSECTTLALDETLVQLEQSGPMVKKRVLAGLFGAAASDASISYTEAELLRVVADALDCPMPPLTAGPVGNG